MNTVLVDTSNICHICYYSYYSLRSLPESTPDYHPIISSIFNRLSVVGRKFKPNNFVFALDSPHVYRKQVDFRYKAKRKKNLMVSKLIARFVVELKKAGFRNIVELRGYEADDIIAGYTKKIKRCVIVSNDQDFFQRLSNNTQIYNITKRSVITVKDFKNTYGIKASKWEMVKAIGGCNSDGVVGVPGVGEKTAIKYILGKLDPSSVYYKRIKNNMYLIKSSKKLVSLPFTNIMKLPQLKVDKVRLSMPT